MTNPHKMLTLDDAQLIVDTLKSMPYEQVHKAVAAVMNAPTVQVSTEPDVPKTSDREP